ncbi:MAG: ribosome maturation factor RimP [Mycoplasmatales bacterium]
MAKVVDRVEPAIKRIIEDNNFELYDIEYEKEGKNIFLRIFIDSNDENGVDLEACVIISREINCYLDENELNEKQYLLEVSSPGIIRKLKTKEHYEKQIGNKILVKTFKKLDEFESKKILGIITEVSENSIMLNGIELLFVDIAKAETTFEF